MASRVTLLIATGAMIGASLFARPAAAETVYEFVSLCRGEKLGYCFDRIATRLNSLNSPPNRRICLPTGFGGMVTGVLPVSLLDIVRLKLSAAQFGDSGSDADQVLVRIVNGIYPCDLAAKR
jgi:hypothetical protein